MNRTVFALTALLLTATASRAAVIGFDREVYEITPGESFTITIVYDASENPGLQAPSPGLLTAGLKVLFPSQRAQVRSDGDVWIPELFESNGAGGPPEIERGIGMARFFGVMKLDTLTGYRGTTLLKLTLQDLTPDYPFEPYMISLARHGSHDKFIDMDGEVLDDALAYRTAMVIPEPACVTLLAAGGLVLLRRRRSARR